MSKVQVILSICCLLSLLSKVSANPLPMLSYSTGHHFQLKGFLFCVIPSSENATIRKCWPMKLHRVYNLVHHESQNPVTPSPVNPGRSSESLSEEMEVLEKARLNLHLYLDHMWHLNIGFTR